MLALKAGATYFALVFAVGFILGPVRVLWIIPRFGQTVGLLLEAPLLLVAMLLAARWTLRRFAVPATLGSRATMGLVAFALLMMAEIPVALWVRGLPLADYLAGFATVPGAITLSLFLLFAVMPLLVEPV